MMGETRVDLLHLLEDLRDAYPGAIEETIISEIVANSLDSGATTIRFATRPEAATLTVIDDGSGMKKAELARYHDIAATTKTRGRGIGFAGVGIKLGLLVCDEVVTETRRGKIHAATTWRLTSRKRAPWKWIDPPGLVGDRGTAVRLSVRNSFSPLVDPRHIEETIRRHFTPLLDPFFDEFLSRQYPEGVRFVVNGRELERRAGRAAVTAPISVRLPRKRKPSALGYMIRIDDALTDGRSGLAISTYGKVIKRGWDWLGLSPEVPERIGGMIEAPGLAECLTLAKSDFIRSGQRGAIHLAYRKAIQEAVGRRLAEWGDLRDRQERERRRAAAPAERDLQAVLVDLAEQFPLLSALVERHAGGQRALPTGLGPGALVADARAPSPAEEEDVSREQEKAAPVSEPPEEPPAGVLEPPGRRSRPRRPGRYSLRLEFESRPESDQLARLVEATVWVNEAHPACRRAAEARAMPYHIALAAAMALAPLAAEPADQHEFVNAFLTCWGNAGVTVK
jgi:anti-sigma regulatory factor (Ser/Thr protein kinase)